MKLYPLKFTPYYCYRMWGGNKLKTYLGKDIHEENIGESWEISDVKNYETLVSDGALKGATLKELIKNFKGDFLGHKVYENFSNEFPLLIKFIDAKTPLSIQVHPSDALAKERHNSFGKNEMWYIMQADKDAELIVGFNQKVEKEIYLKHLENTSLTDILNIEKVSKGDAYYIPTGRVHAIGAGVLLAEIQQSSNITYRIYDYDRVDDKIGEKRELHTELALGAIDYNYYDAYKTNYNQELNTSNKLIHSPFFKTNFINVSGNLDMNYKSLDSFVIYMCVDGSFDLDFKSQTYSLKKGETLLLPAVIDKVRIKAKHADILEIYL